MQLGCGKGWEQPSKPQCNVVKNVGLETSSHDLGSHSPLIHEDDLMTLDQSPFLSLEDVVRINGRNWTVYAILISLTEERNKKWILLEER